MITTANNTPFKSFADMLSVFTDDSVCRTYLESKVWENGVPTCPYCKSNNHYILKTKGEFKGMYKCAAKGCKKRYTVTIGTMFEGTHVGLRKWFIAIYLFSLHKKGISSHQLATDLGITQKSAWFMLHRIREAFGIDDSDLMGGEGVVVEVDETYVGGKNVNMSNKKRKAIAAAKEARIEMEDNKTAIIGYLERGGKLRLQVMRKDVELPEYVSGGVAKDSVLMTDSFKPYSEVGREYAFHGTVNHSKSEYVKDKVIHTNTIEGAFSLFDRMVIGIYHNVSPKHLQAYCNEHEFRYNNRKESVNDRFDFSLRNSKKLPYAKLIAE